MRKGADAWRMFHNWFSEGHRRGHPLTIFKFCHPEPRFVRRRTPRMFQSSSAALRHSLKKSALKNSKPETVLSSMALEPAEQNPRVRRLVSLIQSCFLISSQKILDSHPEFL